MKTYPNRRYSIALAFTALTAAASANAVAASDTILLCKDFQEHHTAEFDQLFSNLGQCVSFFRTHPVETCQILKEYDLLMSFFGYKNQGECVVDLSG